jgi:hypothetical protein
MVNCKRLRSRQNPPVVEGDVTFLSMIAFLRARF